MVLNSVRAEMVPDASCPSTSYRATAGLAAAPAWLETDSVLWQLGSERWSAQDGYARSVTEGIGQESIWGGLRHQVLLGSDRFVARFA